MPRDPERAYRVAEQRLAAATEGQHYAYCLAFARSLKPWMLDRWTRTPGLTQTMQAALAHAMREHDTAVRAS